MNRKVFHNFLNKFFNNNLKNELTTIFRLNDDLSEYLFLKSKKEIIDTKEKNKLILETEIFKYLFKSMDLKIKDEYIEKFEFNLNLDFYKLEDDKVSYYCEFNINQLYDIIFCGNEHQNLLKIYRIEDIDGKGAYSSNISIKSFNKYINISPEYDGDINLIYPIGYKNSHDSYHLKWKFGFEKIEDINKYFFEEEDQTNFEKKIFIFTLIWLMKML